MGVDHILFMTAFSIGFFPANAWDIAVAVKDQIQFLNRTGEVDGLLSEGMAEVRALAYNSELRRMYFSDNERPEGSIFQLVVPPKFTADNHTAKVHTVVSKQAHQVKAVAYDDMTGILYWTNGRGHAVLWVHVDSDQPQPGQPLVIDNDQIPMGVAIDTCKRYLYWTNCGSIPSVERSLLDGSGRKTLVSENLLLPYAIVVDQNANRLYWVDERPGVEYSIESTDLNGEDRKVLIHGSGHQPFALAVTEGNVFWADHIHKSVWRVPLDSPHSTSADSPQEVASFRSSPQALASTYSGHWDSTRCNKVIQPVMKVIPATITKTTQESPVVPVLNASHPTCFNKGIWLSEALSCDCLPGYSGALCEVDECLDYCVHGSCRTGRVCECDEGYTGPRCENSVCHNYCVTGTCSIDLTGQPQCHCQEGYAGDRCHVNYTQQQELRDNLQEVCSGFCKLWAQAKEPIQPYVACSCSDFDGIAPLRSEWKKDYVIAFLIIGLFVMTMISVVISRRYCRLRKQPRIKKRIIVNKSVTPLTCRPSPAGGEQCEITIENCCNMNICETPCFEPDFRQPQATLSKDHKGGKEEKKTLLGNMELPPDDLY